MPLASPERPGENNGETGSLYGDERCPLINDVVDDIMASPALGAGTLSPPPFASVLDSPRASSKCAIESPYVPRYDPDEDAEEPPMRRTARVYAPPRVAGEKGRLKYMWELAPVGRVTLLQDFSPPPSPPFPVTTAAVRAPRERMPSCRSIGTAGGINEYTQAPLVEAEDAERHKLDQLRATAIAGNDIASSCLYAAGVTLRAGGTLAPIATLLVCIVLYLFRWVYSEICSALPMNGGTYNALLNTSTKPVAALAAVLSLLSYTATAVTSAASAGRYLNYEWEEVSDMWVAVGILVAFAVLTLIGISESANTATLLFVMHVTTMGVLVVAGFVWMVRDDFHVLRDNLRVHDDLSSPHGNYGLDLFYGFSAALLGITGFESSSNYIEEQKPGVFPKTLRNMWVIVLLINPAIVLLSIGVMPLTQVVEAADYSMAKLAEITVGPGMRTFLVIDATLVLAGAVLTAYVGVGGLLRRMALDAILPSFFLHKNECRGTDHVTIITFCILCCSLRLLVSNMDTLGGVYSIAFLGVMSLFCLSNLALKQKRDTLERSPVSPIWVVVLAFLFVFIGVIGNMAKSVDNTMWFLVYFGGFGWVVVMSLRRVELLKFLAMSTDRFFPRLAESCRMGIVDLRKHHIAYFSTTPDIAHLNKVMQYIDSNEYGRSISFIYCNRDDTPEFDSRFESSCAMLDIMYPKATVNFVRVKSSFDPVTVDKISVALNIRKNFMFIACPTSKFPETFSQYGGLRVVTY
eukprot:Hpha_TRINITY_DN12170_c0_g1::TRINITY_DN12170_c0_g1_i1::g.81964::m.81964